MKINSSLSLGAKKNKDYATTYFLLLAILLSFLVLSPTAAEAGSSKYKKKAREWCGNFIKENPQQECRVQRRAKLCPKKFVRGSKFGGLARGYDTCIRGSKTKKVVDKAFDGILRTPKYVYKGVTTTLNKAAEVAVKQSGASAEKKETALKNIEAMKIEDQKMFDNARY